MRLPLFIATALIVLACSTGCEGLRDAVAQVVGAPTSQEMRDTAAKFTAAEEAIGELKAQQLAAERESAKLKASEDRIGQRREVLERMQSELASKLATSPPEARQVLLASIRELDAQLEGLTNESAAVARVLADYEEQLARIEVAAAKARRDLAEHEATLLSFDERTAAAVKRTTEGVQQVGTAVSALGVPGAGAIAGQVSGILEAGLGLILGGGATGALVGLRARKRAREIEEERDEAIEQRDGARRVITTTERFGIDAIASDPNVRKQARAALAGDEVARQEFALAKADAI